ncbi:nucleoid-associated protein [Vagococcus lutrae]|uniref:nucleoid-associated protein n=1 Tax=Vagococcus lutrae TaxID=81947 RepID=UPI00200FB867|nr:nucleoid-associated protein [Vagococcus lutrae]UQF71803.1 nucleoid-associated protein [Vagococcus lutrae]
MIKIKYMIVHKLNIKNPNPILRNECIEHTNSKLSKALDFFEKHLKNVEMQSSTRRCQFDNLENNVISKRIADIINASMDTKEETFIRESKEMTITLSRLMRQSSSTSDGSLFIILYEENEQEYIGLLKMNLNDGVRVNDDLSIDVFEEMLPSTNEKLHKSAIILLKEYNKDELHLKVLDKQASEKEPAKFFMINFLNAKELADNKNTTLYLQSEIPNYFLDKIEPKDMPTLSVKLRNRFSEGREFDIDSDIEPIVKPLLKKEYENIDMSIIIKPFKEQALKKYTDISFKFIPDVDVVKEIVYRSNNNFFEMKLAPDLSINNDYVIEKKSNGDVLITLKNGIGNGLEIIPVRGR